MHALYTSFVMFVVYCLRLKFCTRANGKQLCVWRPLACAEQRLEQPSLAFACDFATYRLLTKKTIACDEGDVDGPSWSLRF
jgi:hypothetical protein